MKNLKLFKRGCSILTATTISLTLVGCGRRQDESKEELPHETIIIEETQENTEPPRDMCTHFTILIGEEYETYKECDGYNIYLINKNGACGYTIYVNDGIYMYMDGLTSEYTVAHINHNVVESNNPAIQKVKTKEAN